MLARWHMPIQVPPIDFEYGGGNAIEHVTIVGHHDQATSEGCKSFLKELDSLKIEVVGWLVEDHAIPLGHKELSKCNPLALAPR
jgi:hypothetical protein